MGGTIPSQFINFPNSCEALIEKRFAEKKRFSLKMFASSKSSKSRPFIRISVIMSSPETTVIPLEKTFDTKNMIFTNILKYRYVTALNEIFKYLFKVQAFQNIDIITTFFIDLFSEFILELREQKDN